MCLKLDTMGVVSESGGSHGHVVTLTKGRCKLELSVKAAMNEDTF